MPPDWLLWLLPVPLATLGAVVWATWAARAPGPKDAADTVEQYERFRAALGSSVQRGGTDAAPDPRRQGPDGGDRSG